MNCQQFEARIHELLDERRELIGDARLDLHRRACSACEYKFRGYEALERHLRSHGVGLRPLAGDDVWIDEEQSVDRRKLRFGGRRPLWVLAALAAAILAMAIPAWNLNPSETHTRVAENRPLLANPPIIALQPNAEIPWPEVLATIEDLPKQLEGLGPVYSCTAQMTGVSSLTSSLNFTVDFLRLQLGRDSRGSEPVDDPQSHLDRAPWLLQTA